MPSNIRLPTDRTTTWYNIKSVAHGTTSLVHGGREAYRTHVTNVKVRNKKTRNTLSVTSVAPVPQTGSIAATSAADFSPTPSSPLSTENPSSSAKNKIKWVLQQIKSVNISLVSGGPAVECMAVCHGHDARKTHPTFQTPSSPKALQDSSL